MRTDGGGGVECALGKNVRSAVVKGTASLHRHLTVHIARTHRYLGTPQSQTGLRPSADTYCL